MKITITDLHKELSHHTAKANPVAIAMCMAGLKNVFVDLERMTFVFGTIGVNVETPEEVKVWLMLWDKYIPCEDLSFHINLIERYDSYGTFVQRRAS